MSSHPVQRRYRAEDLLRIRPAHEQRRYVASQRSGRIDPNPHQIDAVIFALERIPEGGCILADEVGLGKTIEAGLVIAQLLAEGRERVLLITPKALLGQWRQELFTLFHISAREWSPELDLAEPGVLLVTRDFAGGEKGAPLLGAAPPFDLCVIDEAHEVFAGIYKRFDRSGVYLPDSDNAKMAGRVRRVLERTPVLLLTATPIQNSLTELWGLAQFVEPTGTLLGNLATFRAMFCAGDDRRLIEGQEHELRQRVAEICQRTLRRQAQEFMERPFVGRRTRLFKYEMSEPERALYDDVTSYLLEPGIQAFSGNHRQLLLIGFHRRMASSLAALAASLEKVAERLEKMARGDLFDDEEAVVAALLGDLEEDELDVPETLDEGPPAPATALDAELERVRGFIERARSLPGDAKLDALEEAVRWVMTQAERGEGNGKIVVFTESITTQEYIAERLVADGVVAADEVTLFRGTNDGPAVQRALERWREDVTTEGTQPSREVAVRLALVHEFREHSRVFISTEAGAKGLNLQFAGTLINYDLPWNPQRIEQRIGRIHRYGQTRDVLVINFVAEGNEADELLLEILTRKLDLFGTVLGASDEALHEPSADAPETLVGFIGPEFEAQLNRIHSRARTQSEIESDLRTLRENMSSERERFEAAHRRAAGLIETRFDEQVKRAFRQHQTALRSELAAFDRDLEAVVGAYLDVIGASCERQPVDGGVRLVIGPESELPAPFAEGATVFVGDARCAGDADPLHLGHALVQAALVEAREATAGEALNDRWVCLDAPPEWADRAPGQRGRLRLVKVRHQGYEVAETLLPVVVFESDLDPLSSQSAAAFFQSDARWCPPAAEPLDIEDEDMDDAVEELLFVVSEGAAEREQQRFRKSVAQIERSVDDRVLLTERQRATAQQRRDDAERARDAAVGAEQRTRAEGILRQREAECEAIAAELDRLRARDDTDYRHWMKDAHARRSRPPVVETLLDVAFVLEGADG